jgi:hypothetical protein
MSGSRGKEGAIRILLALEITATIVVLATYIVVFNLNNISRGLGSIYIFYATDLVAKMKKNEDKKDSKELTPS